MPYISIVMPVYNTALFLNKSIQGILGQTFSDFELILINDGSTDHSLSICKQMEEADKRVIVYDLDHKGVSFARNFGIKKARGEFLLFMDSDDYIPADYYQTLVEYQSRYGRDNLIITSIKQCKKEKTDIFQYDGNTVSVLERKKMLKIFKASVFASPVNKLYNLQTIKENGLFFDEKFFIAEDILFNLSYFDVMSGDNVILLNNLYYYYLCQNPNSLTQIKTIDYYEIHEKVYKDILFYCRKWEVEQADFTLLYWWFVSTSLYGMYGLLDNKLLKPQEALEKCNQIIKSFEFKNALEESRMLFPKTKYFLLKYCDFRILYSARNIYHKFKKCLKWGI